MEDHIRLENFGTELWSIEHSLHVIEYLLEEVNENFFSMLDPERKEDVERICYHFPRAAAKMDIFADQFYGAHDRINRMLQELESALEL